MVSFMEQNSVKMFLKILMAVTDTNALNYDENALCDNGSCVYGDNVVSNLEEELSVFESIEEVDTFY